jgi:hypothetical protein
VPGHSVETRRVSASDREFAEFHRVWARSFRHGWPR